MLTVTLVPEDSTDPIVAEVFADIKATKKIDFRPGHLEGAGDPSAFSRGHQRRVSPR